MLALLLLQMLLLHTHALNCYGNGEYCF
eukprot:COSAG02_NODE_39055_length_421_cov_1.316770_1_plen_27_part_01